MWLSGMLVTLLNTYVSTSTGFDTMTYIAFGATTEISEAIDFMIFTFVCARSKRVCPGFLPMPDVMTTISEPAASE